MQFFSGQINYKINIYLLLKFKSDNIFHHLLRNSLHSILDKYGNIFNIIFNMSKEKIINKS